MSNNTKLTIKPLTIGEFPVQRPVTRSFGVFFDLRLNKRLNKQPWAVDLRPHRGHYDVNVMGNAHQICQMVKVVFGGNRKVKIE